MLARLMPTGSDCSEMYYLDLTSNQMSKMFWEGNTFISFFSETISWQVCGGGANFVTWEVNEEIGS